ncbi:hypothetical protein PAXRUDRAFT_159777, partial [Paxillus rubicundulus Ve08.2h10]
MEHPEHTSASGHKYVLDIIDDFLSYCWATGLKVGVYRSDNGELKSEAMCGWLLTQGTQQHSLLCQCTSAQNSCVECLHCTLMGKAHAM